MFEDWSYDMPEIDLSDTASSLIPDLDYNSMIPFEEYVASNPVDIFGELANSWGDSPYQYTPIDYSQMGPLGDAPMMSSPESLRAEPSFMSQANSLLQDTGKFFESPGGRLGVSLLGGGISALDAIRKNKLSEKARKKYEAELAARKAKAEMYDAPLRLTFGRAAVQKPSAGANGSEAQFFTGNKLPSYFAEGGSVRAQEPSPLGFLKYLLAGKKLPQEVLAEREALRQGTQGTMVEGAAKIRNRQQQLQDQEKAQGLRSGGYLRGEQGGQDDVIPIRAAGGEYMFDADVVSALGDGNNEAGARKLDEMREAIRSHKRSAPTNKIPPKAKSPLAYLKGVK